MRTTYTSELDRRVAKLLALLDENGNVQSEIDELIDPLQQGIFRNDALEGIRIEQVSMKGYGDAFKKPKKPGPTEDSE